MEKVAVIGGAGFVGSNLVRRLIHEGSEVLVVDDFSTGLRSNLYGLDCRIIDSSILNQPKLLDSLAGASTIVHLAARGSVPRSIKNPQATFDVNVVGTLNVLNAARELGSHLVFSSSSSVYGRNSELPKHEKSWTAPMTPYAASKLSGEALIQSYSESFGVPSLVFRFFNIFGPGQRPGHPYAAVIPRWIWQALNKEPIEVYGDGSQSRDFTYIDTAVDVIVESIKRKLISPLPINLAFGTRTTLNQLIDELREFFPYLEIKYSGARKGDIKDSLNDPSMLRQHFPKISPITLTEGLKATKDWLERHGEDIVNQTIDQS